MKTYLLLTKHLEHRKLQMRRKTAQEQNEETQNWTKLWIKKKFKSFFAQIVLFQTKVFQLFFVFFVLYMQSLKTEFTQKYKKRMSQGILFHSLLIN